MTNVYEELGVRTIINVAGISTRVGGALMPPEVVSAMSEAAKSSVSMTDLQAAASRFIATITGAEAGYVTSGASASLTLGAAAIIAGLDPGLMERLPNTTGMKNEFVVSREHRTGYDHAIRVAGGKLTEVGMNEQLSGAGVRRTEVWEFEAAINSNTVGILYTATPTSEPPLTSIIKMALKYKLPVLVDAAGQLPPVTNLTKFIELGADLVAFSGGKGLRGPQSSGILCGRRDYIASVALQNMDMDEYFDIWDPPEDFIPKSNIIGIPRHGIGRGFKISKEEIIGLITALKLFSSGKYRPNYQVQQRYLKLVAKRLTGLKLEPKLIIPKDDQFPLLHIILDTNALKMSGFEASRKLKLGAPGVFVSEKLLHENTLIIHPINLDDARTEILIEKLIDVLGDNER
ncbi:MAG: L-seryl-tRNA(Ser) seleniumtransferase [Chloroflexi bacterium]|jgi:L-seryl-tRNA(Ser) seleniumtransferase|nr:MAG: L-seryl-tRNA(Ser) seleniumtransferase [Chloroflexota bacterium]